MDTNFKLRNVERFTRFTIGLGIVLSILVAPLTPVGIIVVCALAIYPLFTSLVGLDPIFYIIDHFSKNQPVVSEKKVGMAL